MLACLRLVPTVQEVVDVVAEVATPGHLGVGTDLPARFVTLVRHLGEEAAAAWVTVGDLWNERGVERLRSVLDQVDGLADTRSAIAAELASDSPPLPVALEGAVVTRVLDRIGRTARTAADVIGPLVPDTAVSHNVPGTPTAV